VSKAEATAKEPSTEEREIISTTNRQEKKRQEKKENKAEAQKNIT
jgi:hypothetical protein